MPDHETPDLDRALIDALASLTESGAGIAEVTHFADDGTRVYHAKAEPHPLGGTAITETIRDAEPTHFTLNGPAQAVRYLHAAALSAEQEHDREASNPTR